jgi:hypothetical protein
MQAVEGQRYLEGYARAVGRLVGNLLSLELALRTVLHESSTPPAQQMPRG